MNKKYFTGECFWIRDQLTNHLSKLQNLESLTAKVAVDQAVEGRDWPRTVVSILEGFQTSLKEAD